MQVSMYVELGLTHVRRPVRVRVGEKRKKGDPALIQFLLYNNERIKAQSTNQLIVSKWRV